MLAPGTVVMEKRRKRKAETLDNDRERMSKRFSRLNIEPKPKRQITLESPSTAAASSECPKPPQEETMQLDDSKHKVYIYDIDAELSSDSDNDDGKLVFLPQIEKHLRQNPIPRHILANDEGELAGMQLVLYRDPKTFLMPDNKDIVRKAMIEARRQAREEQKLDRPSEIRSSDTPLQTASQTRLQTAVGEVPHSEPVPAHISSVDDTCDAMEVD